MVTSGGATESGVPGPGTAGSHAPEGQGQGQGGGRPYLLVIATVACTVEAFLAPYARHFRSMGWKVDAAAHDATGSDLLREAFDDVYELPVSRSLLDIGGILAGGSQAARLLEKGPDIVHVHTPIAGFLTRFAARRLPRERRPAVVYTAHGFHFHQGGSLAANTTFTAAEKLAGRWTDRLVVINDEDEAAARRNRIVPPEHLIRMPGIGIDTDYYWRDRIDAERIAQTRENLSLAPDIPLFVTVAELSRRKRPQDAVKALSLMRNTGAHLALAGVGPELADLEALAARLGVGQRVHFLGFVADVRPLLCAARALILCSDREGLARSVMEGLSLELPVLASTARGNRELVGDDAGVIYDVGDTAALAEAMDRIIDRPQDALAMGRRGRERMVEGYGMPRLFQMHEALYGQLLAERARR